MLLNAYLKNTIPKVFFKLVQIKQFVNLPLVIFMMAVPRMSSTGQLQDVREVVELIVLGMRVLGTIILTVILQIVVVAQVVVEVDHVLVVVVG
jgi:hypothetical protein